MFHGDEQDGKVDRLHAGDVRRVGWMEGFLVVGFHDVESIPECLCMFLVPSDDGNVILTGEISPNRLPIAPSPRIAILMIPPGLRRP